MKNLNISIGVKKQVELIKRDSMLIRFIKNVCIEAQIEAIKHEMF